MDTTGPCTPADNSPMMWWAARTFTSLRGCIVFRTEAIRAASVGTSTMFRPQPGISCRVSRIRRGRLDRPPTFTSSNGSSGLVLRKPLCEARSIALPFHLNSQPERGKQTPKAKPTAGLHADIDRVPRRMRRYCVERINSSVRQVHLAHLFPRRCRLCQSPMSTNSSKPSGSSMQSGYRPIASYLQSARHL